MTFPFLSYPVPPTGTSGLYARTLPAQLADIVNVKDFGAIGDGVADDTVAVQAAFDAAWGPPGASHSGTMSRPVFFPAGIYRVINTIYVESVTGGWIIGQGSRTTTLYYDGPVPNRVPATQEKTSLFFTNGFRYCRIEGITFAMKPGVNTPTDKTVCFNWNWQYPGGSVVNTTMVLFIDVGFQNGTIGCSGADDEGIGAGLWGNECDAAIWLNCWADNCYTGLRNWQWNCINAGWYGGSIRNCSQSGARGMYFKNSTYTVQGVDFSNNDFDIMCESPILVVNCKSTSSNFSALGGPGSMIIGCDHQGTTPGNFAQSSPMTHISIDNCKTNGDLVGQGTYFIRESNFSNPNWANPATFGGKIAELGTTGALTFAQLPDITKATEGLMVSISDSPTATWGATVSGGSGSNHVLLNASGNTARGSITFSAQPADNSTITLGGTVITLHDGTGGAVDRGASLAASVDNLVTYINNNFQAAFGVNASASGSPHNKINLVANVYGSAMNTFRLVASTSPASNGAVSASTLLGGTGPIWTVVGK